MVTEIPTELHAFKDFLEDQIEHGRTNQSPEQALELWRAQQRELRESVAAVKQALADMEAGDTGTPLDEFADEFRKRNNIPRDA